jgi:hypothetical protein
LLRAASGNPTAIASGIVSARKSGHVDTARRSKLRESADILAAEQ